MTVKLRVAFTLFSDDSWTGGINYLSNLFFAINSVPDCTIIPVLFISPDNDKAVVDSLSKYLSEPPIVVDGWGENRKNKIRSFIQKIIFQLDKESLKAFRFAKIDVVFQNDKWYGLRFPIPTVAWIADFQHKHLTDMFTPYRRFKRDLAYTMLCRSSTQIMVSSLDAANDCKRFFVNDDSKISAIPFAIQIDKRVLNVEPSTILTDYNLPKRYLYFPGQLWMHKNHLALLEAISIIKKLDSDVVVVFSGNPKDGRNPNHPNNVLNFIEEKGLQNNIYFLGMVPYEHIVPLMRNSVAMINPSLFEGWSTTVEEAKALGVPMLLSNLNVHKEQAPQKCFFFNPRIPSQIAKVINEAWCEWEAGPRYVMEKKAVLEYSEKTVEFANKFESMLQRAVKQI
jgi:glycosyltransferase involved in cell wall biosynthesis